MIMKFALKSTRHSLIDKVNFNVDGLICAIAQDHQSKDVLMLAWMNRQALAETLNTGQAVYYSRSRRKLWRKGELSGQTQEVIDIRIDCDMDALIISVIQTGVACHTGRVSCFSWSPTEKGTWESLQPVISDPKVLYGGGDK